MSGSLQTESVRASCWAGAGHTCGGKGSLKPASGRLITLALAQGHARTCAVGQSRSTQTVYKFLTERPVYHTAQERCQADGGGLASFVNLEELTGVKQLAKSYWDAYNVDPDYDNSPWALGSPIVQEDNFWIGLLGKDTDPRDTWANRQPHDFYADVRVKRIRHPIYLQLASAHMQDLLQAIKYKYYILNMNIGMVMTMRLLQLKGHACGRFLLPAPLKSVTLILPFGTC